jgi:hypothetical protein
MGIDRLFVRLITPEITGGAAIVSVAVRYYVSPRTDHQSWAARAPPIAGDSLWSVWPAQEDPLLASMRISSTGADTEE